MSIIKFFLIINACHHMLISAIYGFSGNKEWVFRSFMAFVLIGIYAVIDELQKLNKRPKKQPKKSYPNPSSCHQASLRPKNDDFSGEKLKMEQKLSTRTCVIIWLLLIGASWLAIGFVAGIF